MEPIFKSPSLEQANPAATCRRTDPVYTQRIFYGDGSSTPIGQFKKTGVQGLLQYLVKERIR